MLNSQYYLDRQISRKISNVGKTLFMITFFGDYNVFPPHEQKMKHKQSFLKCLDALFHINHGENHKELLKRKTLEGRRINSN
jgi:hypothetical protein